MGTARLLLGFAGALVVAVGWAVAGAAAARRWVPGIPPPLRQAAVAVLGLAGLLLSAVLLGSLGQLGGWPLVAAAAIAGTSGALVLSRTPAPSAAPTARPVLAPRDRALLGAAGALVAVRWVAELVQTLGRGFSHADELHYHLTHSALFVQTGRTWPISFTSVGDGSAYHPAHAEALHAVALAVVGSDFGSIFLNLGFAVLAAAAGWSIGRHAGNPAAGALVVAAWLALPLVVAESGAALNDTMATALLLVSVALLLEAVERRGQTAVLAVAGCAAGLAAGTKLTVLVAVVGLLLLVAALPAGRRAVGAGAFTGAALVAGGYWYLRNTAHTGNPVPALSFGPLPGPELELQRAVEAPVLDYATDLDAWRDWLVPGLAGFFGPLWPVLPLLVAVGAVAASSCWRQDRRWALLAGVGLLSLAGYAATPTSAAGPPGEPALFEFNLRYALPGALLCAFAGLGHPALRRRPALGTGLAALAVVAANLHLGDPRRTVVAAVVVAAAVTGAWAAARAPRRLRVAGGVVAALATLVVAVGLHDRYLARRWTADLARWPAYEAGDAATGLAIGVTGVPQAYPFFGADLSNRVVTIGDDRHGDELVPHRRCDGWWATVEGADLDVVVVLTEAGLARSDLGRWLVAAPERWLREATAPVLLADRGARVYDVRDVAPSCSAAPVADAAGAGADADELGA